MDRTWLKTALTVLIAVFAAGALIAGAGVLVAVSVGAWGGKGTTISDVANLTRVISGAVSAFIFAVGVSLYSLRRQSVSVDEELSGIKSGLSSLKAYVRPDIDGVLKQRDSLEPWMTVTVGRKSIYVSGMSLRTHSTEYAGIFRDVLATGGKCKFLLIAPKSEASAVVARNFLGQSDPADYDNDILRSLERLSRLRADYPASVEIKILDHVPTSSISVLDHGLPTGKIFVEFYTYEDSSSKRPHLEMNAVSSPVWYGYFENQFQKMWTAGSAWNGND